MIIPQQRWAELSGFTRQPTAGAARAVYHMQTACSPWFTFDTQPELKGPILNISLFHLNNG